MAAWAKIKFLWDNVFGITGGNLSATSTASGYDVKNIYNMLETNMWKAANTTTPMYITIDTFSAATEADSLVLLGHNLNTIGATIGVHYSTDNFVADIHDAFTPFAPTSDNALLKEFTSPGGKRYWRFYITGTLSAAPEIVIAMLCNKTELDYATASYDPDEQDVKANVNVSDTGYLLGIHRKYTERSMILRFEDADSALYMKIKGWWEANGLKNFFVAVDTANRPNDVYLMRPDPKFSNPLKSGGLYRDIAISLKGRKE